MTFLAPLLPFTRSFISEVRIPVKLLLLKCFMDAFSYLLFNPVLYFTMTANQATPENNACAAFLANYFLLFSHVFCILSA